MILPVERDSLDISRLTIKEFHQQEIINKQQVVQFNRSRGHGFKFMLEKINPKGIKGMGSVGYKISSILRDDGDLYISYALPEGTCPKDWDMAAPYGLIKEASCINL